MNVQIRDAVTEDMLGCHRCLDAVAREGRWLSRLPAPPIEVYSVLSARLGMGLFALSLPRARRSAPEPRARARRAVGSARQCRSACPLRTPRLCNRGASPARLETWRYLPRQRPDGARPHRLSLRPPAQLPRPAESCPAPGSRSPAPALMVESEWSAASKR